jgi:hypothetical protein
MPARRRDVALLLVEHEAAVRAYLARVSLPGSRKDAATFLAAHLGPLELVMGEISMSLVAGRELAAVLEQVQPRVPVLAVSSRQWREAVRDDGSDPEEPRTDVPFDPELVRERIAELRSGPAAA